MNEPETIRYAYAETAIGTAVIAASARGVAALLVGAGRARLAADLADALPGCRLVEDADGLAGVAAAAAGLMDAPGSGFGPALDLRGSKLELAVWAALRAVPAGETRSYGQVARALPMAATAQEVGAACAANRVAVAVPCHRVVKADGSISGYRWGVHRKRRLLAMEAAA